MQRADLILGLDIGVASIGWALADAEGKQIHAAGVRIFDAAMDAAKFEAGQQGASHAAARRQARLQRRHFRRRAARHRDLYLALQEAVFLPFAGSRAENRHEKLTELDGELMQTWRPRIKNEQPEIADPDQILCYYLRARALVQKLEPCELGRALYHLGQRRGFKSNRREGRSQVSAEDGKEPERSEIKSSIVGLAKELQTQGLTLGQYLSKVNPHSHAIRNRRRSDMKGIWTSRAMYEAEFDRIWSFQAQHYPAVLNEPLRGRLRKLMFWQRAISAGRPGHCELERTLERAPRSSLLAQHFRVVQAVNNLRIRERGGVERRSNDDERRLLNTILETAITEVKTKKGHSELFGLRFPAVKQKLGIPKHAKLNLDDEATDSYLRGNRTKALMVGAFGEERWNSLAAAEQRRIVRKWIKEQSPEKLLKIAVSEWGLPPGMAERLAHAEPEEGYAALSHVAMLKLLPAMEEKGLTYPEAVQRVYGNAFSGGEPKRFLPLVSEVLSRVPNPAVMRALSELRKVVNAVVREYGTPAQIRIELARSLKRNAEQRERNSKANRSRARNRRWAEGVIKDLGQRPSHDPVDRVLLHRECKGMCVYCGQNLGGGNGAYADLFSDASEIQVEHILPRRCLDDSFSNKVLAHRTCNLDKGDRTPFQAFGTTDRWEDMLRRVEALGDRGKMDRFKMSEQNALEFSNRHLADTRYATKLAAEYLEQLYGGRDAAAPWEDRARRCVYASSGALTGVLRRHWGLEQILKEPAAAANGQGGKPRTDHRHHAIDAIVIALTTEPMVKKAAVEAQKHDRSLGYLDPRYFSPPWPEAGDIEERIGIFQESIRRVVDTINVSHRPKRKLNGQLHQATYYSPKNGKNGEDVFVRTPVQKLSVKDIRTPGKIVDSNLRQAILKRLAEPGGDPKKLETSLPYLETKKRRIPIRSVRIRVSGAKSVAVREGEQEPSVFTEENHHVAVFETTDPKKGRVWYTPGPVSRMEAMRRKSGNTQVVRTVDGRNSDFVFHLMRGDTVEMLDKKKGRKDLYVVLSLSEGDYSFRRHTKAEPSAKELGLKDTELRKRMQDSGDRVRIRNIDELRARGCCKVDVDPLGRIHYSGNGRSVAS